MKKQLKDMFAQVTMPEETEEKIRSAMRHTGGKARKTIWRTMVAAAAVLALVFVVTPRAWAAVEDWVVKYFFPGSDLTIYEQTDANGNVVGIAGVVDTEAPAFARMVNGRLYFLGNNEKIDITDEITEEKPYFYTYVDDYGLTHAMAVGYSGTLENYGIYEFIWEDVDGTRDWVTGTGRNFLSSETETRYPWVDIVWAELDVPWPMPE